MTPSGAASARLETRNNSAGTASAQTTTVPSRLPTLRPSMASAVAPRARERLRGEELRHERGRRSVGEIGKRALLHGAAVRHQGDGAAEESRLADVVRHEDDRLLEAREQLPELPLQLG